MAIIDFNVPIDFTNPETYFWLFLIVIVIPCVIGAVLGAIAGVLDNL